ncbi:hypothetical protein L9F63_025591 [Diploptera punctata]|uniref:Methylcrotonoyl-CoA carboxylase subunit alpha, mitochondrial n=1 Tax=Diploptera punctata TaxID=6984 RepID=A0AAD7Z9P6_DIPPU|nr:hypothetical protein L9F63_025591 [Diploptera punctata]
MGIKSTSKAIMSEAGVPIIKGYHGSDQSLAKLKHEAEQIGFPVMIKAVRGGGGKGMRIAFSASEFESQLESAKREALKSFGDEAMLLEKFVQEPRHVEVQIFGDHHGNYVHLFERDCSVQRRHQKVIEEAPAPGISESLRNELGQAAVRAAHAVGYVGAGTVEFILDRHTHAFHFMEMNTRLQVEHPITEMVTNTDLVEWQLKVAGGEKLPLTQDEINLRGHAFEARIYAESPNDGFLPGAGPLDYLVAPNPGPDVRVETGVRQGDEVSVHYDPMIAKLVVWGEDRKDALMKMRTNLADYNIVGLNTNVDFLLELCNHGEFVAGNVHTNFIEQHKTELGYVDGDHKRIYKAALAVILNEQLQAEEVAISAKESYNPFVLESGFRVNHLLVRDFNFACGGQNMTAQITYRRPNNFSMKVNNGQQVYKVAGSLNKTETGLELTCRVDNVVVKSRVVITPTDVHVFTKHESYELLIPHFHLPMKFKKMKLGGSGIIGDSALSPLPGIVEKVCVKIGDSVKAGDPLVIVIAMKMEHTIRAPKDGIVEKINYNAGENVTKNAVLVKFAD